LSRISEQPISRCLTNYVAQVDKTTGVLHTFIIEPFVPHPSDTEYYICIQSIREGDEILFTHQGGVDVGDVDAKAKRLLVSVDEGFPSPKDIISKLLTGISH
jgi:ATP citrate (pro-S)-lyase